MKLVKLNSKDKVSFGSLEEALAALNAFIQSELNGIPSPEMERFLEAIMLDESFEQIIDFEEVAKLTREKTETREGELITTDEKTKGFRYLAEILEIYNAFLEEDILKYTDDKGMDGNSFHCNCQSALERFKNIVKNIIEATTAQPQNTRDTTMQY